MTKNMGDLIAARRKELGMTQKDLADRLNITDKAVSKWERNLACPDINTIPKLAEVLGVSLETLMQTAPSESTEEKKTEALVDLILKAVPLAMGIALFMLSILKKDLDHYTVSGMAGIGLFAISLRQIRQK